MGKILDYAWSKPSIASMRQFGVSGVSRYLSWLPNGKVITKGESVALLSNGIDIYLNWEYDAHDALGAASAGHGNAVEAVKQAKALGYPAGATIYYSVDFDGVPSQQPAINAYLIAAGKVTRDAGYRLGVYTGYWPMKRCFDAGVVDDGWQTYAWSLAHAGVNPGPHAVVVELRGSNFWFDNRAYLRQIQNGIKVGGADCDLNVATGPSYSWKHPAGKPATSAPATNPKGEKDVQLGEKNPYGAPAGKGETVGGQLFENWARTKRLYEHAAIQDAKIAALDAKLDRILGLLAEKSAPQS